MATDKQAWLQRLGVDAPWLMAGKPHELFLDNAAEFHGEALRRGCDQHGIVLRYRPPGQPHYGGVVERVIGTMMTMVHELPGTTFANPAQRGDYPSEAAAVLTLAELQAWLALAVASARPAKPADHRTFLPHPAVHNPATTATPSQPSVRHQGVEQRKRGPATRAATCAEGPCQGRTPGADRVYRNTGRPRPDRWRRSVPPGRCSPVRAPGTHAEHAAIRLCEVGLRQQPMIGS